MLGTVTFSGTQILRPVDLTQWPVFKVECDGTGKCTFSSDLLLTFTPTVYIVFVDTRDLIMYTCYNWIDVAPYLPSLFVTLFPWVKYLSFGST